MEYGSWLEKWCFPVADRLKNTSLTSSRKRSIFHWKTFGLVVGMVLVMGVRLGIEVKPVKAGYCWGAIQCVDNDGHKTTVRCSGYSSQQSCSNANSSDPCPDGYGYNSGSCSWADCGAHEERCCGGDSCNSGLYCYNNECVYDDEYCSSGDAYTRQVCNGTASWQEEQHCLTNPNPNRWSGWNVVDGTQETCPLGCDGNQL